MSNTHMNPFEATSISLNDAFGKEPFFVPAYQREFVWKPSDVNTLINDIIESFENNQPYFIGTIYVSSNTTCLSAKSRELGLSSNIPALEIIDGQQRLTTTFLLFLALRHEASRLGIAPLRDCLSSIISTNHGVKKLTLAYPEGDQCIEAIKDFVLAPGTRLDTHLKNHGVDKKKVTSKHLLAAYDECLKALNTKFGDDQEALFGFYRQLFHVHLIQITTTLEQTLQIFETINERGVRLNPLDLLKNLLFKHVAKGRYDALSKTWNEIKSLLETSNKTKAKPQALRFIRYFIMAKYPTDSVVRKTDVYKWLTDPNKAAAPIIEKKPEVFAKELLRGAQHYIQLLNNQLPNGEDSEALLRLQKLGGSAYSLHHILLLAVTNFTPKLFERLAFQLERVMLVTLVLEIQSKELEPLFQGWAQTLIQANALQDPKEQETHLEVFIRDRLQHYLDTKMDDLSQRLDTLSLKDFKKERTSFLLSCLGQYFDEACQRESSSLARYYEGCEIEHILPQKPLQATKKAWEAKYPTFDYDEYSDRLGNLTLISKGPNASMQNKPFLEKIPYYQESKWCITSTLVKQHTYGKDTSANRFAERLGDPFTEWNASTIKARQAIYKYVMGLIWDFPFAASPHHPGEEDIVTQDGAISLRGMSLHDIEGKRIIKFRVQGKEYICKNVADFYRHAVEIFFDLDPKSAIKAFRMVTEIKPGAPGHFYRIDDHYLRTQTPSPRKLEYLRDFLFEHGDPELDIELWLTP